MESAKLIQVWKNIIVGEDKSWVLFANGTCVILMEPEENIRQQAIELLKEWGPVVPGSSAGDFSVIDLEKAPGYVVTSHHNDILTYVSQDELGSKEANDLVIGMLGRSKRDQDAEQLQIIYATP